MEMTWKFWCTNPTKAARRYQRRLGGVMALYIAAVYLVTAYVRDHHPHGAVVYILAALPTLPILGVLVAVGLYLREEIDEYKRMQLVRAILCGIAATFVLSTFTDFLRSYDAIQALPPFTLFVVFWVVIALVSAVQSMANGVKDDEEPAA